MIRCDGRDLRKEGIETPLEAGWIDFGHGSREDQGIPLLHFDFEMSRDIEVLFAVEAAPVLVRVGDSLVPARCRHE